MRQQVEKTKRNPRAPQNGCAWKAAAALLAIPKLQPFRRPHRPPPLTALLEHRRRRIFPGMPFLFPELDSIDSYALCLSAVTNQLLALS